MKANCSHRSAWPYVIAVYFAVVITAIAIFITWAVKQNMDLVRNDYYEQEILFQQHIDALARAKALGSKARLNFNGNAHALLIQIPSDHTTLPFKGTVHLYRPSDARLDRRVELKPSAAGEQLVNTAQLAPGLWKARVEWTANRQAYLLENNIVVE